MSESQRGPPKEFPGKGRDDVPGNAPFEEVKDTFQEILDMDKGEGRLAVKVEDSEGNTKEELETRRVEEHGSVEIRPFQEKKVKNTG